MCVLAYPSSEEDKQYSEPSEFSCFHHSQNEIPNMTINKPTGSEGLNFKLSLKKY